MFANTHSGKFIYTGASRANAAMARRLRSEFPQFIEDFYGRGDRGAGGSAGTSPQKCNGSRRFCNSR